jgi:hypothetical protein
MDESIFYYIWRRIIDLGLIIISFIILEFFGRIIHGEKYTFLVLKRKDTKYNLFQAKPEKVHD